MDKPAEMFDRDFEWSALQRFIAGGGERATLGVVSGRRRQGKTFLLDALCRATGGFYFVASEATEARSLRQLGTALAEHRGHPAPYRFDTWDDAITVLFSLAQDGPLPVVLDEFPYLVKASPELPSIIQRELGPAGQRRATPVRLLLCGSAMSFMGSLLSGNAPLRGRAGLELVVPTFDYRLAAEFWGLRDPRLAVLTHAIVGGTPAYRREYSDDDAPADLDDFDNWVERRVLNPTSALFREARYLLTEEPDLRDPALYHDVLGAIATGNASRGGIANYLARKSSDLAHPLAVLEDAGLIVRDDDVFRANRSIYRVAEPLITFYEAIMQPAWADLERPGRAAQVWERSWPTFRAQILGPHFEEICRYWTRWFAATATFGAYVSQVGRGVVNDAAARMSHELDVVALARQDGARHAVLAIGEAKWSEPMGLGHLRRLRHVRELLRARDDCDASATRLLCFSGSGFSAELRAEAAAAREEIILVDLDRLYHGE